MSTYRYFTTDLITGQQTSDWLPLVASSVTRVLCGTGTLTGYLDLSINPRENAAYVEALEPESTMLWVCQDNAPVWCGILWDLPIDSIASRRVPLRAQTVDSLLAKRLISGALTFNDVDVCEIARQLVQYATSPAIGAGINAPGGYSLGAYAAVAGLEYDTTMAGVTDTMTFGTSNTLTAGSDTYYGTYADYQPVSDALTTTAAADGFEYDFAPIIDPDTGAPAILMRTGYPQIGQPVATQQLTYPGNCVDYAAPRSGANGANWIIGMSTPQGGTTTYTSQPPYGIDMTDMVTYGHPIVQSYQEWPGVGVTSQQQINAYVQSLLPAMSRARATYSFTSGPGAPPLLRDVGLGDVIQATATSDYHPADPNSGAPGLQLLQRVVGWTLVPPAEGQTESVTWQLGQLTGEIAGQVTA